MNVHIKNFHSRSAEGTNALSPLNISYYMSEKYLNITSQFSLN